MGTVYEYLTFNGKSSRDFEVWISGSGTFDAPERDVESVSIPGRNGDLHIDNGRFKNISITYPAFITKDFRHNFDAFKAYMLSHRGYKRLADSYHPEYFRLAEYKGAMAPKMSTLNRAGSFDVTFDCDPRRFLVSGELAKSFTKSGQIKNPTLFDALPLIRVYGCGIISVGGIAVRKTGSIGANYVDLDCELQEAYLGTTSRNDIIQLVDGEFPKLHKGINEIKLCGFNYGGNYAPGVNRYPSSEWSTEELKAQHVGNTFYDSYHKIVYIWQEVADAYAWVETTWDAASEENNKTLTRVEITPRWWTV